MAAINHLQAQPKLLLFFLNLLAFSLLLSPTTAIITHRELESAIFALRANGYNLFANSIAVSDLSPQILSLFSSSTTTSIGGTSISNGGGITLLAPPNSALFSLDMSAIDAASYVHSLRYHIIPRRLSFLHLRNLSLSSFPYLETLIPNHLLFVASSGDLVSVDGVRISFPDLYLRSDIAAHGLDGILATTTTTDGFHGGGLTSISMPPLIDAPAYSPESDESPAPSPLQLAIWPPETSQCGDWSSVCDDHPDFLSPRVFAAAREPVNESGRDMLMSSKKQRVEESQDQDQDQGEGQTHDNFAKY